MNRLQFERFLVAEQGVARDEAMRIAPYQNTFSFRQFGGFITSERNSLVEGSLSTDPACSDRPLIQHHIAGATGHAAFVRSRQPEHTASSPHISYNLSQHREISPPSITAIEAIRGGARLLLVTILLLPGEEPTLHFTPPPPPNRPLPIHIDAIANTPSESVRKFFVRVGTAALSLPPTPIIVVTYVAHSGISADGASSACAGIAADIAAARRIIERRGSRLGATREQQHTSPPGRAATHRETSHDGVRPTSPTVAGCPATPSDESSRQWTLDSGPNPSSVTACDGAYAPDAVLATFLSRTTGDSTDSTTTACAPIHTGTAPGASAQHGALWQRGLACHGRRLIVALAVQGDTSAAADARESYAASRGYPSKSRSGTGREDIDAVSCRSAESPRRILDDPRIVSEGRARSLTASAARRRRLATAATLDALGCAIAAGDGLNDGCSAAWRAGALSDRTRHQRPRSCGRDVHPTPRRAVRVGDPALAAVPAAVRARLGPAATAEALVCVDAAAVTRAVGRARRLGVNIVCLVPFASATAMLRDTVSAVAVASASRYAIIVALPATDGAVVPASAGAAAEGLHEPAFALLGGGFHCVAEDEASSAWGQRVLRRWAAVGGHSGYTVRPWPPATALSTCPTRVDICVAAAVGADCLTGVGELATLRCETAVGGDAGASSGWVAGLPVTGSDAVAAATLPPFGAVSAPTPTRVVDYIFEGATLGRGGRRTPRASDCDWSIAPKALRAYRAANLHEYPRHSHSVVLGRGSGSGSDRATDYATTRRGGRRSPAPPASVGVLQPAYHILASAALRDASAAAVTFRVCDEGGVLAEAVVPVAALRIGLRYVPLHVPDGPPIDMCGLLVAVRTARAGHQRGAARTAARARSASMRAAPPPPMATRVPARSRTHSAPLRAAKAAHPTPNGSPRRRVASSRPRPDREHPNTRPPQRSASRSLPRARACPGPVEDPPAVSPPPVAEAYTAAPTTTISDGGAVGHDGSLPRGCPRRSRRPRDARGRRTLWSASGSMDEGVTSPSDESRDTPSYAPSSSSARYSSSLSSASSSRSATPRRTSHRRHRRRSRRRTPSPPPSLARAMAAASRCALDATRPVHLVSEWHPAPPGGRPAFPSTAMGAVSVLSSAHPQSPIVVGGGLQAHAAPDVIVVSGVPYRPPAPRGSTSVSSGTYMPSSLPSNAGGGWHPYCGCGGSTGRCTGTGYNTSNHSRDPPMARSSYDDITAALAAQRLAHAGADGAHALYGASLATVGTGSYADIGSSPAARRALAGLGGATRGHSRSTPAAPRPQGAGYTATPTAHQPVRPPSYPYTLASPRLAGMSGVDCSAVSGGPHRRPVGRPGESAPPRSLLRFLSQSWRG